MRLQVALLICLALAALTLGLAAAAGGVVALETPVARYEHRIEMPRYEREHRIGVPRTQAGLQCARPSALHLVRFEDGSAQLKCGARVLARISVPGR